MLKRSEPIAAWVLCSPALEVAYMHDTFLLAPNDLPLVLTGYGNCLVWFRDTREKLTFRNMIHVKILSVITLHKSKLTLF